MNSHWCLPALAGVAGAMLLAACGSAQTREARYIQHGQQYFAAGKYDKARIEFSNAAQIDPKDPKVRYLLGEVAEKLGDMRGAVGQYQAALSQDSRQNGARAALARIYLYAGLPQRALDLVRDGLAIDPNDAQLLTARGAARAQLGDTTQAMQDAQRAVQLAPGNDYAVALLSSLDRRAGHNDQAIAVVQAGLKRLPASVDLRAILADLEVVQNDPAAAEVQLRQIITLQPEVLLHRYRLARFYLQRRRPDDAERTLRAAVEHFPQDVDVKLQLAAFLDQQRSPSAGIAAAEQFMKQEPHDDVLQLALADFLMRVGQAGAAADAYHAVVEHDGTGAQGLAARDRLAALALAKKDQAGAQLLIGQVLDKNPRDTDALLMRANLSLASDDAADAIVDLRAVLRDQPNNTAVLRTLAGAYEQNDEHQLAEETLRSAVQIAPKDVASQLALARVLTVEGSSDQAEAILTTLAQEDPKNLAVQEALFQAQLQMKKGAQALAAAHAIEMTAPKSGLGFYLEGLADESLQQSEAAQKAYEQALELDPKAAEPLTALVRLDLSRHQAPAALSRLASAQKALPDDPIIWELQGEVQLSENMPDAAIASLQRAVKVAPTWARGYNSLAAAELIAHQPQAAIQSLRQGLEQTAWDRGLLNSLSNLYIRNAQPEQSIALYQQMLSRNPHSVFAANNLAMLLVTYRHDTASLAQAERLSEQLASLSSASVIDTRGWVKFKSGDFHGAESLLQEAVDKSPGAAEMRYHLGMAQLRSGESQAARQNLQAALQSTQPFDGMQDARAALAQLRKSAGTSG